MRLAQCRTASRGGSSWDDDGRRGETPWKRAVSRRFEAGEGGEEKEREWYRVGSGRRDKRGDGTGQSHVKKRNTSERDGDPAKMRAWQREDSWGSERIGDRVVIERRGERTACCRVGARGMISEVSEKENAFIRTREEVTERGGGENGRERESLKRVIDSGSALATEGWKAAASARLVAHKDTSRFPSGDEDNDDEDGNGNEGMDMDMDMDVDIDVEWCGTIDDAWQRVRIRVFEWSANSIASNERW